MRIYSWAEVPGLMKELQGALTITQFAKKLRVSRQVMSLYLNGKNRPPSKVLRRLGLREGVILDDAKRPATTKAEIVAIHRAQDVRDRKLLRATAKKKAARR